MRFLKALNIRIDYVVDHLLLNRGQLLGELMQHGLLVVQERMGSAKVLEHTL